jgi:DNA polymerase III subunit epsilon
MNWAAIDFETANADRASACALGLVVIQEAQIVKRRSWLIRPKGCFDLNNVAIHGITADHVAEEPTFAEHWDEVHSEIRGMPLVVTVQIPMVVEFGAGRRLGAGWRRRWQWTAVIK